MRGEHEALPQILLRALAVSTRYLVWDAPTLSRAPWAGRTSPSQLITVTVWPVVRAEAGPTTLGLADATLLMHNRSMMRRCSEAGAPAICSRLGHMHLRRRYFGWPQAALVRSRAAQVARCNGQTATRLRQMRGHQHVWPPGWPGIKVLEVLQPCRWNKVHRRRPHPQAAAGHDM